MCRSPARVRRPAEFVQSLLLQLPRSEELLPSCRDELDDSCCADALLDSVLHRLEERVEVVEG